MVKCQVCGEEVNDSKFCPNCGSVMDSKEEEEQVEEVFEEEIVEEEPEEVKDTAQSKNTKFCSNCGTEVDINAVVCTNCGAALSTSQNLPKSPKMYCTNCGSEIDVKAVVCPYCGVATQNRALIKEKSVAAGVILNFFVPGLGHIVTDFTHRGLNFLVMYIVSIILAFLLIGFILIPIVWIWSMVDVSKCINAY